jgi:predicted transcriptional regulator
MCGRYASFLPAEAVARLFHTVNRAVAVKRSIFADHIVCLDCGKHLSMLKRHLMTDHKLSPESPCHTSFDGVRC